MQNSRLADALKIAHQLAELSDPLTLSRFRAQDLMVQRKADLTLVSDADRAAEDVIRAELARLFPSDAVLGEERGSSGVSDRQWIIDPIDGTHNFVRGVPVWATLIALVEDGEVVLGLVSAPALHRRWWAASKLGAFAGSSLSEARELNVSRVGRLEDAFLSYSSLGGWEKAGRGPGMDRLMKDVWRTRGFGDFWSYMMVAEGVVDLAAEPELAVYDMAALVPIVTEAGGRFTSLQGEPGPWGGNAVASNGLLHDQALAYLAAESQIKLS